MSFSLEQLRSSILDSIKGRKIGLNPLGYLVGPPDNVVPVSAGSTAIDPYGFTSIASTTDATYTMLAPVVGVSKQLVATTTSTGVMAVRLASGSFVTTGGSSFNVATFTGIGQSLDLIGLSTSLFGVNGIASAAFSTY